MSSKNKNKSAKNKKTSTDTKKATNKKKDENKNIFLEYMEDVDEKMFKEYSDGKDFNSFINKFDRATYEEDKQKVIGKLKGMGSFANHDIERNKDSEYRFKLVDIVNATDYFFGWIL